MVEQRDNRLCFGLGLRDFGKKHLVWELNHMKQALVNTIGIDNLHLLIVQL